MENIIAKTAEIENKGGKKPAAAIKSRGGNRTKQSKILTDTPVSLPSDSPPMVARPVVILHLKCFKREIIGCTTNTLFADNAFVNDPPYMMLSSANVAASSTVPVMAATATPTAAASKFTKEITYKLKQLCHNLHNNVVEHTSACFWCTCEFDNHPIYIPKGYSSDKLSYNVYGCFCSPECAAGFLFSENIDISEKHNRLALLNSVYGEIFDYKQSIKPARDPRYLLQKFAGNLSIQEYRALFGNAQLFHIMDKPMVRILPELHEDNDDYILNRTAMGGIPMIKRRGGGRKPKDKNTVANERFGAKPIQ